MKRRRSRHRETKSRRLRDILLAFALLGLLALVVAGRERAARLDIQGRPAIVDGDTLRFSGERVRLLGIDAPERDQTCERDGRAYTCGQEARTALARIAGSAPVHCSGWERDRYRRLLATCRAGGQDLSRAMVAAGWAVAYGDYRREEAAARAARQGLWTGTFTRPQEWRRLHGHDGERRHDAIGTFVNWLRQILFDRRQGAGQE